MGYRFYSDADYKQMSFIFAGKKRWFSLSEIKELLQIKFHKNQHSCHEVKAMTLQKRDLVAARIAELTRFYDSLFIISR